MGVRAGQGAGESRPFPERVGRYDVLLPIASGGMATVYLGRSRGVGGFEREVALKLTHAHLRQSADFAAELLEEGKLAAQIRHPNVVPVLDAGEDASELFLVMEYIEGDTLSSLERRSTAVGLPLGIGLRIILDALAGLHAAHELTNLSGQLVGVVHRDFSPQNILVGLDGVSRLADFGVAKAASRLSFTQTGFVKGKTCYMSPEQARGQDLDRRCDVWAAGVVAWELLAGRPLHPSQNDAVTLLKIVTEEPPRLSTVRSDIPPELEDAVAHALTIDLDIRCPDAATFARELATACHNARLRIAEAGEVGAHVAALVGGKLKERRERVAEILELRGRMDRLATTAHEMAAITPAATVESRAARFFVDAGVDPTVVEPAVTVRERAEPVVTVRERAEPAVTVRERASPGGPDEGGTEPALAIPSREIRRSPGVAPLNEIRESWPAPADPLDERPVTRTERSPLLRPAAVSAWSGLRYGFIGAGIVGAAALLGWTALRAPAEIAPTTTNSTATLIPTATPIAATTIAPETSSAAIPSIPAATSIAATTASTPASVPAISSAAATPAPTASAGPSGEGRPTRPPAGTRAPNLAPSPYER